MMCDAFKNLMESLPVDSKTGMIVVESKAVEEEKQFDDLKALNTTINGLKLMAASIADYQKNGDVANVIAGLGDLLDLSEIALFFLGKEEPELKSIAKKIKPMRKEVVTVAQRVWKEKKQ